MLQDGGKKLGMRNTIFLGRKAKCSSSPISNITFSFMPSQTLLSDETAKGAVRRAAIEVFALKGANMPLTAACQIPLDSDLDISDVKFVRSAGGTSVVYGHEKTQQSIIDLINTNETAKIRISASSTVQNESEIVIEPSDNETKLSKLISGDEAALSQLSVAQEADPTTKPSEVPHKFAAIHDNTWVAVSLRDDEIKFAVSGMSLYIQARADSLIGVEACNAVDRQADLRSSHIQARCSGRACGCLDGKA